MRTSEGRARFDPAAIAKDIRNFLKTDKAKIMYEPNEQELLRQHADRLKGRLWLRLLVHSLCVVIPASRDGTGTAR